MMWTKLTLVSALVVGGGACTYSEQVGRTVPPIGPGHLELRWAVPIGGLELGWADRVAIDVAGDVFVAGGSHEPVDFSAGPATLPAEVPPLTWEPPHAFLAKRAAVDGAHLWGHMLDAGTSSTISRLAGDGEGGVYAVGHAVEVADAYGRPADADLVVARYDEQGALLWRRGFGGASLARGYAAAVRADGGIVVAGLFAGTLDLANGPVQNTDAVPPPGQQYEGFVGDVFIASYDANGVLSWVKAFPASGFQVITRLAIAPDGEIVAAGYTFAPVSLGGADLEGLVLGRFTAAGEHVWSRTIDPTSSGSVSPRSLDVDDLGNIVTTTQHGLSSAATLTIHGLDSDGATLGVHSATLPGAPGATAVTSGALVSVGDLRDAPAAGYVSVSDPEGTIVGESVLAAATASHLSDPSNAFPAVDIDAELTIAVAVGLSWGLDAGSGVIWPHGAGPIDGTGSALQFGGRDGLVAVYDWIED
jgi:hypothetical protein